MDGVHEMEYHRRRTAYALLRARIWGGDAHRSVPEPMNPGARHGFSFSGENDDAWNILKHTRHTCKRYDVLHFTRLHMCLCAWRRANVIAVAGHVS